MSLLKPQLCKAVTDTDSRLRHSSVTANPFLSDLSLSSHKMSWVFRYFISCQETVGTACVISTISVCWLGGSTKSLSKRLPVRSTRTSPPPCCRGTQCNIGQYQPMARYTLFLVQLQGCQENNEALPIHNSSLASALSSHWTGSLVVPFIIVKTTVDRRESGCLIWGL